MKALKIIRIITFLALGVLTIIFANQIMENKGEALNIVVGVSMILFAINTFNTSITSKNKEKIVSSAITSFCMIIIALVMMIAYDGKEEELMMVCILWGICSILGEANEISESIFELKEHKVYAIANIVESIILIAFSIVLIINPGEKHARVHVYLLGIEMIFLAIWPILHDINKYLPWKKKQNEEK